MFDRTVSGAPGRLIGCERLACSSRSRNPILAHANWYSDPRSSPGWTRALEMIRIRWRTWSNARTVSNIMKPAAGSASSPPAAAWSETGSNHAVVSYPRKPTAPPVNLGRSGTTGDLKSAIRRRSVGMNGSVVSLVTPARSIVEIRAQHEEGVFPQERIAADVLATFHALEEERVVRVLRDLQERGHRREQVGHDLLADRHERALRGQRGEFSERRDLHAAPVICLRRLAAAARIRSRGADVAVHHSNCSAACATSISRPPTTRQPAAAASRSNLVSTGLYTRSYTRFPPSRAADPIGLSTVFGHVPTGVALTSRSQLPGSGRPARAWLPGISAAMRPARSPLRP